MPKKTKKTKGVTRPETPKFGPDKPNLTMWQVIERIQDNPTNIYHSHTLMDMFGITHNDASMRLMRLNRMGFLKYADRSARARGGYILTDYGIAFKVVHNAEDR